MNIWRTEKVTRGGWIEANKNSSQELLVYVPTLLMNNHQSHTHTHMESDVLTLGVIIKQRWSGQITLEASDRRLRKYCWTLRATGYSGKLPDGPTLSGQHARELKKNLETQPNDLQKSQNLNHSFVFRWRTSSKRIHTKKNPTKTPRILDRTERTRVWTKLHQILKSKVLVPWIRSRTYQGLL